MTLTLCCSHCFESIKDKYNLELANLWLEMCKHFIQYSGIFKLRETRVPWLIHQIRTLEKLGYITTCDGLEAVSIRVNGYEVMIADDKTLEMFCLDQNEHRKMDV